MPTPEIRAGVAWFGDYFLENRERLERLGTEGQAPTVLFIGCCDSRVPPELITGARPGEMLVARTIGNLVPPLGTGDMGIGALVEVAILHLPVRHAILCGHTDCSCLKALEGTLDWSHESHLARWAEHARPAKTRVDARSLPADERHLATARENVLEQLEHLRTYDPVRNAERSGVLALHAWVYHVETGVIEAYDPEAGRWDAVGGPRNRTTPAP